MIVVRNHFPYRLIVKNLNKSYEVGPKNEVSVPIATEKSVIELYYEDLLIRPAFYVDKGDCYDVGVVLATRKYSSMRSYTSDLSAISIMNGGFVPGFICITPASASSGGQPLTRCIAKIGGYDGLGILGGSKSHFFVNEVFKKGDILSFSYELKGKTFHSSVIIDDDGFKDYEFFGILKNQNQNTHRIRESSRIYSL